MKNPEILAPAGSLETLYAAIAMGADAVYVGAPRFGARAFAENPSVEELTRAINDCHLHGKRLYLTTNTLLTEEELEELIPMMDPLVEAGLDAAIVQDPGVLMKLHEAYPGLALHASTQMALFSGEEAELLRPYGVTRFVPARELTIEEIRKAREQTDLEIEVFVHGALCVCYSGWCLMSEHIGGRSGNRGMCAGPCRLPYERPADTGDGATVRHAASRPNFELNTRDIETLLHIPELIEAGIDSFKIEGRMKKKEYASYIAHLYRHYADVYLEEGADHYRRLVEDRDSELWRDRKRAMELYNRGGFFSSFLFAGEDEPTIEPLVKGHYGLPVGTVTTVNRTRQIKESTVEITLTEDLHPQDVLTIRDKNGETAYEFTVAQTVEIPRRPMGSFIAPDGTEVKSERPSRKIIVPIGFSAISEGDIVCRTRNASLLAMIDEEIERNRQNMLFPIRGVWTGRIGEPVTLEITGEVYVPAAPVDGEKPEIIDFEKKKISVVVNGDVLQKAETRPVTADDVGERLVKLGGSGYRWLSLQAEMKEGAFLPLGKVKELRRDAIRAFEAEVAKAWRGAGDVGAVSDTKAAADTTWGDGFDQEEKRLRDFDLWLAVSDMEQLETVLTFLNYVSHGKTVLHVKLGGFSGVEIKKIHTMWQQSQSVVRHVVWAFSLPRAYRGRDRERLEADLVDLFSRFTEGHRVEESTAGSQSAGIVFIANSVASIVFHHKHALSMPMIADENLYMWNDKAKRFYREMGVHPEVPRTYGRIPVMTTAHAIPEGEIVTPKKDRFLVVKPAGIDGRMIYTAEPEGEIIVPKEGRSKGDGQVIDFTTESRKEIEDILKSILGESRKLQRSLR